MDYTMYLPGMGRIPTKPILSIRRKSINDSKDDSLKKNTSGSTSIEKPIVVIEATDTPVNGEPKNRGIDDAYDSNDPALDSDQNDVEPVERTPQKAIYYRTWPGGPMKSFLASIRTEETENAASMIQKVVRGKCARTKFYIFKMERHVEQVSTRRLAELEAIQNEVDEQKVSVRRKLTQKQATILKKQLDTQKVATEGSKLIHYLRSENKKLRQKNDKIAASIHALRIQNETLENLTSETGENHNLLGTHYDKIQETNTLLVSIVPQYESKVNELQEALDVRKQYCDAEQCMKIMYMKLIGTITEMMEQHCNDQSLIDEITQYCTDLTNEVQQHNTTPNVSDELPSMIDDCTNETTEQNDPSNNHHNDEEYEEISVGDNHDDDDNDDSDSNNYDDYTIANLEE
jgi:hypothetical protein